MYLTRDTPAWYDLGIEETTLQIWVRNDVFEFFISKSTSNRLTPKMIELSGAELIAPTHPTEGMFGFGPLCKYQPSQRANWVLCEIALPNWDQPARSYVCTLALLLNCLEYWDISQKKDTLTMPQNSSEPIPTPQLMTVSIEWAGTDFRDAWGLWVAIGPTLAHWIAKQSAGQHKEISKAIKTVAWHMWSERMRKHDWVLAKCRAEFSAYNGVWFGCDGDACELSHGGAQNSNPNPPPYTMGPHNVDSPQQQFSLLAGAAKLCQIARQDIG